MANNSSMTLARLHALLDAYGADPSHWPPQERDAACALLTQSAEARRGQEAAARLDAALDLASIPEPSPGLLERILAATPPREKVAPVMMPPRIDANSAKPDRTQPRLWAWQYARVALPLAAAAALVLWVLHRPEAEPEPNNVALAEIGVYHAPTDVLLDAPGLDALSTVPSFGCTASGLGCVDTEPLNQQSSLTSENYA